MDLIDDGSFDHEFTGRTAELDLFRRSAMDAARSRILVFHGVGGIGKSWLLRRFGDVALEEHWHTAFIDFSAFRHDYLSVLSGICSQIPSDAAASFYGALDRYRSLLQERYFPSHESTEVSPMPLRLSETTLIDVAGPGLATLRSSSLAAMLDTMKNDLESAFLAALYRSRQDGPLTLLFDTVEQIEGYELSRWLPEICIRASRLGSTCVVAGRNRLKVSREARSDFVQNEVSYFVEPEVDIYLRLRRGLAMSEPEVHRIFELTRGHPLCVGLAGDLLARLADTSGGTPLDLEIVARNLGEAMVSELLMERILERETPTIARALMIAAITRSFDAGTLEYIGAIPESQAMLDKISRYSFVVSAVGRGYRLHEIVRRLLLLKWRRDNYTGFLEANSSAASYYEQLIGTRAESDDASSATLNRLYHLLIVDENRGMTLFREMFELAESRQQREYCDAMTQELTEYSQYVREILT
jgi:AAA ATPase domain